MTNEGGKIAAYVLMSLGFLTFLGACIAKILALKNLVDLSSGKTGIPGMPSISGDNLPPYDPNLDSDRFGGSGSVSGSSDFPIPFGYSIFDSNSYYLDQKYDQASRWLFIASNVFFMGAASAALAHLDPTVPVIFNFLATVFATGLSISAWLGCKNQGWPMFLSSFIASFAIISMISEF